MHFVDILWIFLLLAAIQPVIHRKKLEASRERASSRIERKRKSRVLNLIFREEVMSFLGFPLLRYGRINDPEGVIRALEMTDPAVKVDVILHVPEGVSVMPEELAMAVARRLSKRKGSVAVHVPHYAFSSSSLMALVADEIYMGENAVLGQVDEGMLERLASINLIDDKRLQRLEKLKGGKKFFVEDLRNLGVEVRNEEAEVMKSMSLYPQPFRVSR